MFGLSGNKINKANATDDIRIIFSEDVTNFVQADVTEVTTGGTGNYYSLSRLLGTKNVFDIGYARPGDAEGTVTFSFASTTYEDIAGNLGTEDVSKSFTYDTIAPTITTITADPTTLGPNETATLTFNWSEAVDEFDDADDITVSTGTVGTITEVTTTEPTRPY